MGIEENKDVVFKFIKALETHDVSIIDEIMSSDGVIHSMGLRDTDREQLKAMLSAATFSDAKHVFEDVIAEGDRVSLRFTVSEKHTGKYNNIEPTGKSVTFARFSIYRIQDGKVAECWTLLDSLGLFQQLGALPPTEEPVS